MNKRPPHLQVKRGLIRWYVRMIGANGETMMHSQKYYSRANAIRAANDYAEAINQHRDWRVYIEG